MSKGAGEEKLKVLGQKAKLFFKRKVRGKTLNQSPDGLNIQLILSAKGVQDFSPGHLLLPVPGIVGQMKIGYIWTPLFSWRLFL